MSRPRLETPDGAIDAHLHVFDPDASYPPGAGYIPQGPEMLTVADLRPLMAEAGIARVLLVQPSGFGTDNTVMLRALDEAEGAWSGIAVVAPDASDHTLRELSGRGVVGFRLNLQSSQALFAPSGNRDLVPEFAQRAGDAGMAIQLLAHYDALPDALARLEGARTIVLDHLGLPEPGRSDPAVLTRIAADKRVHVKLSGAFRLSRTAPPHDDVAPFVAAALAAFGPERCVWGSDWPFINAPYRPAYIDTLELLSRWIPDPGVRRVVLVETPQRLFFAGRAG